MRKTTMLAAVCAIALGAAACGDEDEPGEGQVSTGSDKPAVLRMTVTEAGKRATLKVPAEAKSGVTKLSLRNRGQKAHEAQIVRVEGEQTAQDVLKSIASDGGPIPDWIADGGGVGTVAPGRTGEVIQELKPGRYVAFDTQGVDDPRQGAAAEFTVTDEKGSDAEFPETDATITAKDYAFETSGLKAGDNVITFENTGKELHHAAIFPVKKGATWKQVRRAFSRESGNPPVDFRHAVFTAVIDGGVKQVTRIPMAAGKYAFACFITDRKGGPPHVAKGMLTEVDVK